MKNVFVCKEIVEAITSYIEGTMSPRDVEMFETHLKSCEGCRSYLEQMRETIAIVGARPSEVIPIETTAQLERLFAEWVATRRDPPGGTPSP